MNLLTAFVVIVATLAAAIVGALLLVAGTRQLVRVMRTWRRAHRPAARSRRASRRRWRRTAPARRARR